MTNHGVLVIVFLVKRAIPSGPEGKVDNDKQQKKVRGKG